MMFKVESFTAKVKRNLRVIVLISSHEKEMGAYAVHACHDKKPVVGTKEKCLSHISSNHLFLCINEGPVIVTGISLLYQRRAFYRDRHEQRRYPFPFHGMSPLFQRYTLVQVQSHISSDHLLILSIFLSSISSFSQIDTGWESV